MWIIQMKNMNVMSVKRIIDGEWKMEKMTMDAFKEYVKKNDDNVFNDEGLGEHLNNIKSSFILVCKKCGSTKVEVIGEEGYIVSEYTGYSEGTNVIKCNNCGNADQIWI